MLPDLSRRAALTSYILRHRPDIIHAHSTYPCGYNALKLGGLAPPVVVTPHGEDINVVPEIGFGQRLNPAQAPKIEYAVRHAAACTAISDTVYNSLVEVGTPKDRIVRIRNGVDIERFAGASAVDVKAHFGWPQESQLITTIGNFHPRKGHAILVEAVAAARAKVPNLKLAIVGRTSEAFCEEVAAKGYGEFIHFLGTLPVPLPGNDAPDVLAALLRASRAYVSASMDEGAEGLSLALLEGMAAGATPIVTRISGNRDVIEHEVNGLLVDPGSVEDLANALERICADDALAHRLNGASATTVAGYSWRAVAEEYVALYERVLQGRTAKAG